MPIGPQCSYIEIFSELFHIILIGQVVVNLLHRLLLALVVISISVQLVPGVEVLLRLGVLLGEGQFVRHLPDFGQKFLRLLVDIARVVRILFRTVLVELQIRIVGRLGRFGWRRGGPLGRRIGRRWVCSLHHGSVWFACYTLV